MGATKVMIIRHAEKPNPKIPLSPTGIDINGNPDPKSLIVQGWERAGGIANLFDPSNGSFQNAELATPNFIYASSNANNASQRPMETVSALVAKLGFSSPKTYITSFTEEEYAGNTGMVNNALSQNGVVLISWQHQDILLDPKNGSTDSIVNELLTQSGTTSLNNIPPGPWPSDRFDMVFVFDRPTGSGVFTNFTQVPQMLLAGDAGPFPTA